MSHGRVPSVCVPFIWLVPIIIDRVFNRATEDCDHAKFTNKKFGTIVWSPTTIIAGFNKEPCPVVGDVGSFHSSGIVSRIQLCAHMIHEIIFPFGSIAKQTILMGGVQVYPKDPHICPLISCFVRML